jgi:RNA methyltransferase, TrmH family
MLSSSRIKNIRLLHQKKYRTERNLFLAEGVKVVNELLGSSFVATEIFALPQWFARNRKTIPENVVAEVITPKELERISALSAPNMVVAVVEMPKFELPDLKKLTGFLLILDGISDPGNLGTIIRTADWFGIRYVICSRSSVEVYNPKVVQAAMGSVFRVKTIYTNLAELIKEIKDEIHVYGAFLSGDNLYKIKFPKTGIIVIGSESHGISEEVSLLINHRVFVPSLSAGVESLNASVAAALVCAEVQRKCLADI